MFLFSVLCFVSFRTSTFCCETPWPGCCLGTNCNFSVWSNRKSPTSYFLEERGESGMSLVCCFNQQRWMLDIKKNNILFSHTTVTSRELKNFLSVVENLAMREKTKFPSFFAFSKQFPFLVLTHRLVHIIIIVLLYKIYLYYQFNYIKKVFLNITQLVFFLLFRYLYILKEL